jgi:putative hemolysin
LDALALMQVLGLRRRDLKFIVNDILLQIKNLEDLFIGVNKHGKNAAASLDAIDNLYASDKATLIFPAGLVSRKQNGIIKDLTWKKSFIVKAKKHNRKIVPVHIEGKNSNWFYNLSNWRKRLGIEANIEMLYLMDEMYHQHGKTITITFGKPIEPIVFNDSLSDVEWANRLKEHIYIIAQKPGAIFAVK